MALKPNDAIQTARNIYFGPRQIEHERLQRIHEALKPNVPTVEIPTDAPEVMKRLACKSQTNFLPLIVDVLSEVMKVVGYQSSQGGDNAAPWEWWQRNGLDARQAGVTRSALSYGASYVTVLPGDTGPLIRGVSPRQMTALYQDPTEDDWPMLALRVDLDLLRLYDEEHVYFIGAENVPRSGLGAPLMFAPTTDLKFIEAREHGLGYCPVVRFRDRMLLEGEEQFGVVEPIMAIQQRIDETTFGMMVAQYFAAFKQRYVVGWFPESEDQAMKTAVSRLWTFENKDVKVGSFDETDLTRYLASKASAVRDMAAISQVPAQNLGIDALANISAETLAGLEAGKDRKADEITTSLGESWEQALRAAAHLAGDEASAGDFAAQIRWKDATARSLAQTVDALGKMVTMLHVPPEAAWAKLPDVSDQDLADWRRMAASDPLLEQITRGLTPPVSNGNPAGG